MEGEAACPVQTENGRAREGARSGITFRDPTSANEEEASGTP